MSELGGYFVVAYRENDKPRIITALFDTEKEARDWMLWYAKLPAKKLFRDREVYKIAKYVDR